MFGHNHTLDVPNDVDIDRQTTNCTDLVCAQEFERVWEGDSWSVWYFLGSRSQYLLGGSTRSHQPTLAVV